MLAVAGLVSALAVPAHATEFQLKPWKLVKGGTGSGRGASVSFDAFSIRRFTRIGITIVTRPPQTHDTRIRLTCHNAAGISAHRNFSFEADIRTPRALLFPVRRPIDCWIAARGEIWDAADPEEPTGSITIRVWKRPI